MAQPARGAEVADQRPAGAIDIDGLEIWDAWVLIALALWFATGYTGDKLGIAYKDAGAGAATVSRDSVRFHWISVVLVVLLLADMIWKPFT